MRAAQARLLDAVLTESLDRLSRDLAGMELAKVKNYADAMEDIRTRNRKLDAMGGIMAGVSSFGRHIGVTSSYAAFI